MEGPVTIVLIVFAYVAFTRYLRHRERMASVEMGIPPLEEKADDQDGDTAGEKSPAARQRVVRAPRDHRLGSMVLIGIGISFMLAAFLSVSANKGVERGLSVAIWGLVPFAAGVARYAYHASVGEGEPDCYRRSAFTLIAVGASFIVCVTLSTGVIRGMDRAMAVGVWGLIPLAIGVVMYIYGGMVKREREASSE